MKLLAPALIFCGAAAFCQSPQVPPKMQFAGMTLTIRDDARREIQKDVDALTLHPKYFNIKVERARTYFPTIERIFAEERLPDDFKYLCLQESALIADAVSSSDAVGFWQFKDFTAREMGLRVDRDIDERMNIASASRGAAKYLKQCNHYFNNWVYALQAYQMGAGGVMRMVGDKDLGGRHMEITEDTYWYVKKFLAHKIAFEDASKGVAEIQVSGIQAGGKSLQEIALETSVNTDKLQEFNKWLRSDRIPTDKEYVVIIPKGDVRVDFGAVAVKSTPAISPITSDRGIRDERIEINGVIAIKAIKGETLQALAARGHIGVAAFLRYNEMEIDYPLEGGQYYFLSRKKKKAAQELYTLLPGESIWSVSQKFGVQQRSLVRFNRLEKNARVTRGTTVYLANRRPTASEAIPDDDVAVLDVDQAFEWYQPLQATAAVDPGVRLKVVSDPDKKSTILLDKPSVSFHEVRAADTIYSVARQYGVTIQELMEWNGKKDFSLSVGERLKVYPR